MFQVSFEKKVKLRIYTIQYQPKYDMKENINWIFPGNLTISFRLLVTSLNGITWK